MQNGHYPEYECFIAKKKHEYKHTSNECKHEKRGRWKCVNIGQDWLRTVAGANRVFDLIARLERKWKRKPT